MFTIREKVWTYTKENQEPQHVDQKTLRRDLSGGHRVRNFHELVSSPFNPITGFLNSGVRKTNNDHLRLSPAGVDFNFNRVRVNPKNRRGVNFGKHRRLITGL